MLELLTNACYDGGNLRHVREILLDPNCPPIMTVELQFDTLTIALSAVAGDDAITLTSDSYPGPFRQTAISPWASCIGKPLHGLGL